LKLKRSEKEIDDMPKKIAKAQGKGDPTPIDNPKITADAPENSPAPTSARPFLVTEDFDLAKLRAHSGTSAATATTASSTIRIEKPNRMRFVFVHPTWREFLFIIPPDEKRKTYLVVPSVAEQFPQFCRTALIFPYASKHGNVFLWHILQEDRTGRISDYSDSFMQRLEEAKGRWARFEADQDNRSYRVFIAAEQPAPPAWPSGGMEYLIRKAFEDRIITIETHSVIRELLGEST
jgi:hypothetical protein